MTSLPPTGPPSADHPHTPSGGAPMAPSPDGPSVPAKKSWFARHKVLTTLGAVVALVVVIGALSSDDEAEPETARGGSAAVTTAAENAEVAEATDADEGADDAAPAAEPEATEDPFAQKYPLFEPVEVSGTGDGVVPLPAEIGVVTSTHAGSGHFALSALDANNETTGDLVANTIGTHSGTAAYGLSAFSDATTLQVSADGAWTVQITPVADAPALSLPAEGTGGAVFRFEGDAGTWTVTHAGSEHFAVIQHDGSFPNLMVNDIGTYDGAVPAKRGPAVVEISADGAWSITP